MNIPEMCQYCAYVIDQKICAEEYKQQAETNECVGFFDNILYKTLSLRCDSNIEEPEDF